MQNRQHKPALPADHSISDMTIAAEFVMTAVRASVNGHPATSEDVLRPLKWARLKINEVLERAETPPVALDVRKGA